LANHKSAKKRIRSTVRKTQMNKAVKSAFKSCKKNLYTNIKDKNVKDLEANLKLLFKLTDRAEKRGVLKKNAANRYKSRLASQVHKVLSVK